MVRFWLIVLGALLGALPLAAPTTAAAQFGGDDPEEDDEDTPQTLGRDAFQSGQSKFARGNYGGAADDFREAYQLSPRAELLYNIGECETRDGEPREALLAFDAYLEAISPMHPRRAAIVRRVEALRAEVAWLDAHEGEGPGATPWIVASIGGAVAVAGGILLGVGAADLSTANSAPPFTPPAEVDDARGDAYVLIGVGVGLLTVGLGTLIGGLYWGVTGAPEAPDDPEVEVGLGPGTLHLLGTF